MLMNLLKLLQLSLHPQPVGFVLELASIMEHLKIFPLDSSPFALLARKGERTMLRFALPAVFWAILVSTKVRSAFSTFGFLISTWIKFQWHVLIYDSYLMRH